MRPHATAVLARVRSLGVRLTVTPAGLRYTGLPPGRLGFDLLGDLRLVKAEIVADLEAAPPRPAWVADDADLAAVTQVDLAAAYDRAERLAIIEADDPLPPGWVRCPRCLWGAWRADRPDLACRCGRVLTRAILWKGA